MLARPEVQFRTSINASVEYWEDFAERAFYMNKICTNRASDDDRHGLCMGAVLFEDDSAESIGLVEAAVWNRPYQILGFAGYPSVSGEVYVPSITLCWCIYAK